jgi:hypothetical protein
VAYHAYFQGFKILRDCFAENVLVERMLYGNGLQRGTQYDFLRAPDPAMGRASIKLYLCTLAPLGLHSLGCAISFVIQTARVFAFCSLIRLK